MEDVKTAPKTHLNYGLIIGLLMVVLFVLYYVFGLMTNTALGVVPAVIFIILIIIAQINHAKAVDRDITYGNLFAVGFKTTAVATCIYVLFLIIFLLLVPSYKDQVLDAQRQKMVAKGTLSEDQINAGITMAKKIFTVTSVAAAVFGNLVVGCIGSLIGAAIAKKNPQAPSLNM